LISDAINVVRSVAKILFERLARGMAECSFKLHRFRIDPKSGHWKITSTVVFDGSHNHQAADRPELQLLQLISNTDQAKLVAKTS
jgi:hypothetical protein